MMVLIYALRLYCGGAYIRVYAYVMTVLVYLCICSSSIFPCKMQFFVINDASDGKLGFTEFEVEGSTFAPIGNV